MKFQVVSDIHLEFRNTIPKIEPKADYLFMAGDIGNYSKRSFIDFLDYVSTNWKRVFYITGNHEYYGHVKEKADEKYGEIIDRYDNIDMFSCNGETIVIDGVAIIGCCLWSSPDCVDGINDLKWIKKTYPSGSINKLRLYHMKYFNKKDIAYLEKAIDKCSVAGAEKIIVMTHFMPLQNRNIIGTKYPNGVYDHYYGNMLYDLVKKCDVWISGHTHQCFDQKVGNCRWISNAFGYPDENSGYNDIVFEV